MLDVVLEGGDAFASIGTDQSTGTKLFCLSGHVARPGVYEVPFGTTLAALIDLAGGVAGSGALQAVLLGGAAGSFLTPQELDTPLTFEATREIGATLGSGVIMLFDDTINMQSVLLRIAASSAMSRAVSVCLPRGHGAAGRASPQTCGRQAHRLGR